MPDGWATTTQKFKDLDAAIAVVRQREEDFTARSMEEKRKESYADAERLRRKRSLDVEEEFLRKEQEMCLANLAAIAERERAIADEIVREQRAARAKKLADEEAFVAKERELRLQALVEENRAKDIKRLEDLQAERDMRKFEMFQREQQKVYEDRLRKAELEERAAELERKERKELAEAERRERKEAQAAHVLKVSEATIRATRERELFHLETLANRVKN